MLCQKCGQQEATTYVKTIVNGQLSEHALCSSCAGSYGTFLPSFDVSSFFKGFFSQPVPHEDKCPFCGSQFSEIAESGKIGCSQCYSHFYEKLLPSIQRIHGAAVNKGKAPGKAAMIVVPQKQELCVADTKMSKQELLNKAIQEQRFEDAAVLRDEIKAMGKGGNQGE